MRLVTSALLTYIALTPAANCFVLQVPSSKSPFVLNVANDEGSAVVEKGDVETDETMDELELKRRLQKAALFGLIGTKPSSSEDPSIEINADAVLADPVTKEPLTITTTGTILGGQSSTSGVRVELSSSQNKYSGSTDSYFNLLRSGTTTGETTKPTEDGEKDENADEGNTQNEILNSLRVFIPPQLRPVLSRANILKDDSYIPMRDLFTSPSVSFAYERGWRQGFSAAGFPGADAEYEMVKDYFAPISPSTVVDMSCATGLFTRRLAKGNDYDRVIGCDYSDAMLGEARNRIRSDPVLSSPSTNNDSTTKTRLDLVRCDVGDIPMVSDSVDALHAGAAMHCWPDLDAALSEIHRVLKPGGRFFATTFLSSYFSGLQSLEGEDAIQQMQAFQYFESVEKLEDLVVKAGFDKEKVQIEVLGTSCVVIRAEKN